MLAKSTPSAVQLFRDYQISRSEDTFRALVHCYIDFVYGIACRKTQRTSGDIDDIVQTVFIDLARKAPYLSADAPLGGWLHRHTHFIAAKFLRTEHRRLERERIALEMDSLHRDQQGSDHWQELSPVIDDTLQQLRSQDRDVIVLRFFESQTLRKVGDSLGISEDAAQKRLSRALDRLRGLLQRRGFALSSTGILTTSLQSHASTLLAPANLAGQVATGPWSTAAPTIATTLISPILMMTKVKVIAFGCLAILSALVTAPLARPSLPSQDPEEPIFRESLLSPRTVNADTPRLASKRDRLRDLWATEQLVNSDPDRALKLCMDGETTDRNLWEQLLLSLLPERIEDAVNLILKGRCFRSSEDHQDAIAILLDKLPLDVITGQAELIANSASPGAQPLLEEIFERWALADPEEARQGALALTNPLRRQHALAATFQSVRDVGSESWTLAYESLSPMLRPAVIEPMLASGSLEDKIGWLNQYLLNSHQWSDLVMRTFKASASPREAYAMAMRDGLLEDKGLQRSLVQWAAQEDPALYTELFAEAPEDQRTGIVRSGFQEFVKSQPEEGLRMVAENPELLDTWTISVLSRGARSPQHFEQIGGFLDSSEEFSKHYMSVTNYLYGVARHDTKAFVSNWERYSSVYDDHGKARNIRELMPELWQDPSKHPVAETWLQTLNTADADAAYEGLSRSHLNRDEPEEALAWAAKIENRDNRKRVHAIINKHDNE